MQPQNRRQPQAQVPSLTIWLVVFLILFLLIMVLVFSQYRRKINNQAGGLEQILLGNTRAAEIAETGMRNSQEHIHHRTQPYLHAHPPRMEPPKRLPHNLTPNASSEAGNLRPVQGYGFQLADQLMVRI